MASRLSSFFSELKRRRVFRVAWIYAIAAWLIVQIAATIGPALNWPSQTVRVIVISALLLFPVALILAWAFDLTPEGVERTETSGAAHTMRMPWLRPVVGVALVLVFLGGVYVAWTGFRGTDSGDPAAAVAIFPFEVQGGPNVLYLREGMVNLLSTKLNGAGELRAVDPTALLKALPSTENEEIAVNSAAGVARRFGADLFILGSVTEQGNTLSLAGALYDSKNPDDAPVQAIVTNSRDSVLTLVDQLATRLLAQRFRGPAARLQRTASLTTNSITALKAFLTGEQQYRTAQWSTAIDWFKRALAEDSTFALAAYRLAAAAEWAADFETARPATEQAIRHRERLSRRDGLMLDAFSAWQRGAPAEAEPIYRSIVQQYPDDVDAWYRLGEVLYHYNPVRGRTALEAQPVLQRAIELDPGLDALRLHLAELALTNREFPLFDSLVANLNTDAEATLRRTALRSVATKDTAQIASVMTQLGAAADGTVFAVAAGLAQYLRDFDHAEQVAQLLIDPARMWVTQRMGHLLLAQLDVARGRAQSAEAHLQDLRRSEPCIAPKWGRVCGAFYLEYASLFALNPLNDSARTDLNNLRGELEGWLADSVPEFPMPPEYLGAHNKMHTHFRSYLTGLMSAQLGDQKTALSQANLLEQASDSAALNGLPQRLAKGIRGFAAYKAGDYKGAASTLDFPVLARVDFIMASPFNSHAQERAIHGEALLKDNRPNEALPWFESLLQVRGDLHLAGLSLLRQAEIHERLKNRSRAAQLYTEFAALWEKSDPPLQKYRNQALAKATELKK